MNLLYRLFITPVEQAMELIMAEFYALSGSHGLSIFLLSLTINIVLLPLFQVAERWQEAERRMQQLLKPKLKEYREAFRGEERHAMIQALYRQVGYHPIYAMRSSLGLLLQLPFWIAAYQFLSHYEPLNGASFLFLDDLGKPDRLVPGVHVLPFVMTALNVAAAFFYTRRLSIRDQIQPLVLAALFLALLYSAPSGLLLYWTFNSLFSLLRIAFVDSRYWRPRVTELHTPTPPKKAFFSCLQSFIAALASMIPSWRATEKTTSTYPNTLVSQRLLPLWLDLVLFVGAVSASVLVRLDRFAPPSNTSKLMPGTILLLGINVLILLYLTVTSPVRHSSEIRMSLRQHVKNIVAWTLLGLYIIANLAWMSGLDARMPHTKVLVGILGLQGVLLFLTPICSAIPFIRNMPSSHGLFAVALAISAGIVFVANPIALYASSNDFTAGIHTVLPMFLLHCGIAMSFIVLLYVLVDPPGRKGLTLLAVFSAVATVAYSAIGLKYAGKMSVFSLPVPSVLTRTNLQITMEVLILACIALITTMATIFHHKRSQRVLLSVLLAVACVSALNVYKSYHLIAGAGTISTPESSNLSRILSFSRERNIVILMLDGFPGGYFDNIRRDKPDVLTEYDGFTWYPNTLSAGMETFSSIGALAGGPRYTVGEINRRSYGSISQALIEAYQLLIENFIPNEYSVSYVNPVYVGCAPLDKRAYCTTSAPFGARYRAREENDAPFSDVEAFAPQMLTMVSVLQAVPFFLKDYVYDRGDYLGVYSNLRPRVFRSYKAAEWGVLLELSSGSHADSPTKALKFIQVSIPHNPNALDGECRLQPNHASVFSESVCSLKEIGNFLGWLKDTGIYDVTKLIIVSDHGWSIDNPMFPPDFEEVVPREISWGPIPGLAQPLLLVKDFFANGELVTSYSFLSNADVPSIACSAIGGCKGIEQDPTKEPKDDRVLTHSRVRWSPEQENVPQFDIYDIYEVRNSIFDPINWKKTTSTSQKVDDRQRNKVGFDESIVPTRIP